jgi:transcriptional regulator
VYLPAVFAETDLPTLHQFIEENGFALLCSLHDGKPFATHLPLLLKRSEGPFGTLAGHVARANQQWRQADGREVLAVFSGPHAYVSPAWYEAEDVVPTWNYVAVHATGTLRLVEDVAALREHLSEMVAFHESGRPNPWRLNGSTDYLDRMVKGIVGFRIALSGIEGKWKLSQNHPPERRRKVVRGLRERGGENAEAIARLMEERDG